MLTRVQALNYRSLRHIDQPLESLHVLVGPNASGKTTFLDVINFLSDLVSKGLDEAINARTSNFQDLVWQRQGNRFELAVETTIPEERRLKLPLEYQKFGIIRYEVAVSCEGEKNVVETDHEVLFLKPVVGDDSSGRLKMITTPRIILIPKYQMSSQESLLVARKNALAL